MSIQSQRMRLNKVVAASQVKIWRSALLHSHVAPSVEHRASVIGGGPFDSLIDIGANRGQFMLLVAGVQEQSFSVLAVEPLESPRRAYSKLATALGIPCQIVACALDENAGSKAFHVTLHDDSSSLLRPSRTNPNSTRTLETIEVDVKTLDQVVSSEHLQGRTLLKIDVQGSELGVLKGGSNTLGRVDFALIEVSLTRHYESQSAIADIVEACRKHDLVWTGVSHVSHSRGIVHQLDLEFRRSP